MADIFDLFLFTIFSFVEWRITRAWLQSHPGQRAARVAIGFNAALAFCYLCTYADPPRMMHLPGWFAESAGALALTYLITATLALPVYWLVARVGRHFARPADASRRGILKTAGNLALAARFGVVGYGVFI